MLETYADSSFLVSLYCRDANTDETERFLRQAALHLPFTPLHRIEVRNALRNMVGRGEITAAEQRAAFRQIEDDLREGLLVPIPIEWTNVIRRADDLSEKHASKAGQRTMDLLHVAAAIEAGARLFLSFDGRQRKLAKAAGLKVGP